MKFLLCKPTSHVKMVAPARERGLKSADVMERCGEVGRSREGAWIEIQNVQRVNAPGRSRSREGAWIEISALQANVARENGRSREGAWIEICRRDGALR